MQPEPHKSYPIIRGPTRRMIGDSIGDPFPHGRVGTRADRRRVYFDVQGITNILWVVITSVKHLDNACDISYIEGELESYPELIFRIPWYVSRSPKGYSRIEIDRKDPLGSREMFNHVFLWNDELKFWYSTDGNRVQIHTPTPTVPWWTVFSPSTGVTDRFTGDGCDARAFSVAVGRIEQMITAV